MLAEGLSASGRVFILCKFVSALSMRITHKYLSYFFRYYYKFKKYMRR